MIVAQAEGTQLLPTLYVSKDLQEFTRSLSERRPIQTDPALKTKSKWRGLSCQGGACLGREGYDTEMRTSVPTTAMKNQTNVICG
jgi:hypothetical protein